MSVPVESYLGVGGIGGVAGLIATLLPAGIDSPLPEKLRDRIPDTGFGYIVYHVIANLICGALASIIGWLAYGSSVDPNAAGGGPVTGRIVLGSIILGLTGTSVLNSLVSAHRKDQVIQDLNASITDLAALQLPPPGDEPPTG